MLHSTCNKPLVVSLNFVYTFYGIPQMKGRKLDTVEMEQLYIRRIKNAKNRLYCLECDCIVDDPNEVLFGCNFCHHHFNMEHLGYSEDIIGCIRCFNKYGFKYEPLDIKQFFNKKEVRKR